jgi:hypothetical protein
MTALLARLSNLWPAVTLRDKPLAGPEPVYAPRPMKGFFAGLTADQKREALAYRGEEDHGDAKFALGARAAHR